MLIQRSLVRAKCESLMALDIFRQGLVVNSKEISGIAFDTLLFQWALHTRATKQNGCWTIYKSEAPPQESSSFLFVIQLYGILPGRAALIPCL